MTRTALLLLLATTAFSSPSALAEAPPFSTVPAEYVGQLSAGRSPLVFHDGTPVKSAADWTRRRAEILADWTSIMGPWPQVLEKPQVEVLKTDMREYGVTQQKVRLQLAPGQYGEGYLLRPPGTGPFAAVLVPFYEPETSAGLGGKPLRDFAWQLAQRGFITLSIGSPGGDARKPVLSSAAHCQPLSYLGYIGANMWHVLAAQPGVDATRIGIMGHSYGGKWAMFSACLWEKYACAVWSDPGISFDETRHSINYQEPWYLGLDPTSMRKPGLVTAENPRTGAYRVLIEKGHDLQELQALMAPRPFLVSGGAEDPPKRWAVLNHLIQVNRILGVSGRVAMTNREKHDPNEESNAQIGAFFEYWLKPKR